ncbi:MAG: MotA/TolQ/ExbB proton channel family protein [Candidatus Marinimicrobia bacterium]|nr:MotA/TolQ/ExbB proton channel family protein [Candidatus Neomarinimicrobiota bacterium]
MRKQTMRWILLAMLACGGWQLDAARAQDEEPAAALELDEEVAQAAAKDAPKQGFFTVVAGSGTLGVILWLALGLCSVAGVALIVDSFITIKESKIAPETLVERVREAMAQGDVIKALKECEQQPSPLASILSSGFSNIQEGFEAIQDSIGVTADQQSERLLQRVNYLNVVGNLAPMLGLLGTVQGMIFAFASLATQTAGAAQQAALAMNISQALYTTAAGLVVAVPAVGFFSYFKNRATNIILRMEAMTMDLIKMLRNVEVVED